MAIEKPKSINNEDTFENKKESYTEFLEENISEELKSVSKDAKTLRDSIDRKLVSEDQNAGMLSSLQHKQAFLHCKRHFARGLDKLSVKGLKNSENYLQTVATALEHLAKDIRSLNSEVKNR